MDRHRSPLHVLAPLTVLLTLLLAVTPLRAQLPDLERGKQALANGDFGAAQRDLVPLAAKGYLEAQLRLASGYSKLETPEGDLQAARWYRAALPKAPETKVRLARTLLRLASPVAVVSDDAKPPSLDAAQAKLVDEAEKLLREADASGDPEALLPLLVLLTAHPDRDQQPRQAVADLVARAETIKTPEAEAAVVRWYRLNQRPERPEIAGKLISRCKTARTRLPECYLDLGRHYRRNSDTAALQELVTEAIARLEKRELEPVLIERLGNAMLSDSVAGPSQNKAAHTLLSLVAETSTEARVRLARLLIEEPALDPETKPATLLESAVAQGSPEAALSLARLYMRGIDVVVEPKTAERLLLKAVDTEPSAHYFLGRLYHRGEVGEAAPVKAANHYLQAARRGYARADFALAQLYSENRGVRVNRANAYLFARLAANGAVVEAQPLLDNLRPQLSLADLAEAETRLMAELALRARLAPPATGETATTSSKPTAVPPRLASRLAPLLTPRVLSSSSSTSLLSDTAVLFSISNARLP